MILEQQYYPTAKKHSNIIHEILTKRYRKQESEPLMFNHKTVLDSWSNSTINVQESILQMQIILKLHKKKSPSESPL